MQKKILPYLLMILSLAGFLDSTYLTLEHYANRIPPCTIVHGCEQVLTSKYASFHSVPTALFGAAYYVFVFLTTIVCLSLENKRLLRILGYFTITGFLASLWFVYLQAFVIRSYCQFCLLSALTSTLIFITGIAIVRQLRLSPPFKPLPEEEKL